LSKKNKSKQKEPSVSEAEAKAAKEKNVEQLRENVISEVRKIAAGETSSVQQALAYVRALDKLAPPKKDE